MSNSSKTKLTDIFTLLVIVLTTFQGLIPTLPVSDTSVITILSAIIMFLVASLTAWKQLLSVEIRNGGLWPTIILGLIATIGGLNDVLNVLTIGQLTGQWIRFGITASLMILNMISKILWPTPQTKSLI